MKKDKPTQQIKKPLTLTIQSLESKLAPKMCGTIRSPIIGSS